MKKHDRYKLFTIFMSGKTNKELSVIFNTNITYISRVLAETNQEQKIDIINEFLIKKINITPFTNYDNSCILKTKTKNYSDEDIRNVIEFHKYNNNN